MRVIRSAETLDRTTRHHDAPSHHPRAPSPSTRALSPSTRAPFPSNPCTVPVIPVPTSSSSACSSRGQSRHRTGIDPEEDENARPATTTPERRDPSISHQVGSRLSRLIFPNGAEIHRPQQRDRMFPRLPDVKPYSATAGTTPPSSSAAPIGDRTKKCNRPAPITVMTAPIASAPVNEPVLSTTYPVIQGDIVPPR